MEWHRQFWPYRVDKRVLMLSWTHCSIVWNDRLQAKTGVLLAFFFLKYHNKHCTVDSLLRCYYTTTVPNLLLEFAYVLLTERLTWHNAICGDRTHGYGRQHRLQRWWGTTVLELTVSRQLPTSLFGTTIFLTRECVFVVAPMRKQVIYTISPDFHNKSRLEKLYLALSLLRFFQKGFMFSTMPVRNRYKLFREIVHCGGGCLRQSVT